MSLSTRGGEGSDMTFYEVLEQVLGLLQRHGKVSYRALKRQFDLDDAYIADLKAEIIEVQQLAVDQDDMMLVWTGNPATLPLLSQAQERQSPPTTLQPEQQPNIPTDQIGQLALLATEPPPRDAERRQLTVMFCDLVGSTELAVQLDPEDLRVVILEYQRVGTEIVQRFDGYIAQYLGDGLLVYFGYPRAHEDDTQRAVRAGIEIVEAISALHIHLAQDKDVQLAMRVGVHTGQVVVGDMGGRQRQEQLALGETPNIAAHIQALAAPNTVCVSAASQRLVQEHFTWHNLGAYVLKGLPEPMHVYQVLCASRMPSHLDTGAPRGLTPLVGRTHEVGLLLERWQQAKDGLGQVVLLSGEAGIGKSRLAQTVKERVEREPHTWLECRCSSYHQHTALYPIIDLLQRALQLTRGDTQEARLHKLEVALTPYRLVLSEVVPLLATLLSFPLTAPYALPTSTPQRQKQQILETLLMCLLQETERQPVLCVVEDLHWVDPSTLEFLNLLVDQVPTTRLCLLLTFRAPFRLPWTPRTHLTQLTLHRLPHIQVEHMIEQVAGGKALPAEVLKQLVARTDGVPLFVEELTKIVLESEWLRATEHQYELIRPLQALAIPATLHDSLMARLDRLGTAKTVAQLGATIGRQFSYELLQVVVALDEGELQRTLGQLVEAELLYQRGLIPSATYTFKHALIQEAAYQSLLKSVRQQYHRQIAQVLVERFPEIVEAQPELLARHYTEAGLGAQAIPHWQRAGQRAIERSANLEAIGHLTQGLEVLKSLPATPEQLQHELALLVTLGPPLLMTKGNTAPEVEHVYTRAQQLCQQMGESHQLFPVLVGLWRFALNRARLWTARELAEQSFSLAQRLHDTPLIQEAHTMLGSSLFFLGEPIAAHVHLEHGIALYAPQPGGRSRAFNSGADPGVMCLSRAAWTLWLLGYPDQALAKVYEALALAQELAHAYSLAFASHYTSVLHQSRREAQRAQERAEATMALGREQEFVQWVVAGMFVRGWALAEQGLAEEGITQLRQALARWRAMGTDLAQTHTFVRLAEAYRRSGHIAEGLRVLAEALTAVHTNAERYYAAEVHRLKGELLLHMSMMTETQQGGASSALSLRTEAETCLQQALELARHQQAKSLELRAVMSLCRLWQAQDRRSVAHDALVEIYGWFTEGFSTPDLQEAKTLSEALQ